MMQIKKIEVWDFCPLFRDGPYVMSHVTQHAAYGRILRISTSGGISGIGEIVYSPTISLEQREHLVSRERDYLTPLLDHDIELLNQLAGQFRAGNKAERGIAFGLDTAYLDIKARLDNISLTELLGGRLNKSIDDYFSISERSVEKIRQRVQIAGPERKVFQLKIGIGSLQDDIQKISATLDAMNENQLLLADANGGWSAENSFAVIAEFNDRRVIWEEPCNSYAENVEVAQKISQPVMLDQCISNFDSAKKAVSEGYVASICIKPTFLGGLSSARVIRDLCIEKKLPMRIDGPWCGDIATAANLHLAAGATPELLVAGCDLREPLLIDPDLGGAIAIANARIAAPPGPGLGIEIPEARIGRPDLILAC